MTEKVSTPTSETAAEKAPSTTRTRARTSRAAANPVEKAEPQAKATRAGAKTTGGAKSSTTKKASTAPEKAAPVAADAKAAPAKKSRAAAVPVFSADVVDSTPVSEKAQRLPAAALLFQAPEAAPPRRKVQVADEPTVPTAVEEDSATETEQREATRRRRGSRGRRRSNDEGLEASSVEESGTQADGDDSSQLESTDDLDGSDDSDLEEGSTSSRRRRRRSRSRSSAGAESTSSRVSNQVTSVEGSTRLEAKRQRRKEGREAGRRRLTITESEFLARREAVDRQMLVRERDGLNQIAVVEDGILVEHYVARRTQTSMVGNVYLGRVQNVLPSMEAAFVDLGKGRNAVLYAGEVSWDAVGHESGPRRIEDALKSGDQVLVQVTKDPIGHKGARLTSQITLAGRHLVLVPSGAMTGISRKLPETERLRLKKLLKEIVPEGSGVIVRTAAEGATEQQLRDDVSRLVKSWEEIQKKAASAKNVPVLLKGEPELAVRVVRDVFNEDFTKLIVSGREAHATISEYVSELAPDLAERVEHWTENRDLFSAFRVDEQLAKGMDRKVWLPSGGSLVIDRTEAMTVVDVNTGRFTGSGGSLEETVTKNNLEAAEEIVRQLRLRDIGGIIVIDFIDMVLESNRDLVLRRLIECLGRDRTRHQVAEVTSLGLVQMTRKRVGQGLVEAFSETCTHCAGRGFIVHDHPVEKSGAENGQEQAPGSSRRSKRGQQNAAQVAATPPAEALDDASRQAARATMATIAAAAAQAHDADEPEVTETVSTSKRGSRRRVVATGTPQATDPGAGIIALPAPSEGKAEGKELLAPSLLDSIVFPEREERAARKAPRRATAPSRAPESTDGAD